MNYPLQTLIQSEWSLGQLPNDSRYHGSATLQYTHPTPGHHYLTRRFVPQPGAPNFATIAQHTVRQNDRLD